MVSLREQLYRLVAFHGTFIDTPVLGQLRVREECTVVVHMTDDGCGTIVLIRDHCEPMDAVREYDPTVHESDVKIVAATDGSGSQFFFPGFIDTHIHASQYPNCGLFGKSTLLDWLETYTFPLEASLADLDIASDVYTSVIKRTLSAGTTTATYYTTIDTESSKLMGTLCSKLGQRALIGKVCMDQNAPDYYIEDAKDSIESCKEMISFFKNDLNDPRVNAIITPRFAPSCSKDLLAALGALAKENELHIQTHLSENNKEISWVKSLFPECKSYTDVYYQHGLLGERTVLAHCIHCSEGEADLIKKTNSGVSHCPVSNSALASGECRVKWWLQKGVSVGLGTDVSGGYSADILLSARHAHLVSRHLAMKTDEEKEKTNVMLSVNECLYLATMGGAGVLHMQDQIGSFDVGKQFDTQLISLDVPNSNVQLFYWQKLNGTKAIKGIRNPPPLLNHEDIIAKWFFNGDDRNVKYTWVSGQLVHSKDI